MRNRLICERGGTLSIGTWDLKPTAYKKIFFGKKDKNMKIKKLLAGIMSAVMVLGIMTFPTFAEETYTVKVGENQYKTLVEALNAVYKSGPHNDPVVIDCVAGADVGAMTHAHVADSIIINGNGAYVSSGERDLEFDTYKFSRSTGAQDNKNGKYLEKDISIKVNGLNGIAAWSQRNTEYKVDLEFTDCENMQRVYLSGGKYTDESGNAAGSSEGINNITLTNCTFDRTTVSKTSAYPTADKTSVYSNNPGTIKITNCNFTEIPVAVNITNKSQGHQDITVENCTFKDCSSTIESGWADFAAPIRFVTKDENATSTVKISDCAITYSEGNTNAGNGDILLGDKRTKSSSADKVTLNIEKTAADIQIHHTGDTAETVKKVSVKADEIKTVKMAEATAVAKVGETEYETLQEAINAAESNATITLLCDTAESIVIGSGKEITLDLNGKTLTNVEKQHTITNNGKLTVTDSSESKSGAVDNVSHGKAALFNAEGSTAELNGGKFLRSEETGTDQDTSGGNSYYTIQNLGNMVINSGVTVENSGKYSSMITNGYYDISKIKDPKAAILTINGGNFRGGLWAVKNDDMAVMKINDGYFESHGLGAFLNNNVVEINGGTFVTDDDKLVLRNVYYNNTYNLGTAKIRNGNFTGKFENANSQGNISISGGTFSTDVSEYCVDGFKAVKGADGRYTIEEANWGKYTDSGCYVFNDTKYGMMRFMFAFTGDITGKTIQSYGIKYINANKLDDELTTDSAVSKEGSATAFQGDIVGIDYDTANTSNYYAAAYIKFDDNTVIWSAPQKCKINWNRTFTKYAPQTSEKRR